MNDSFARAFQAARKDELLPQVTIMSSAGIGSNFAAVALTVPGVQTSRSVYKALVSKLRGKLEVIAGSVAPIANGTYMAIVGTNAAVVPAHPGLLSSMVNVEANVFVDSTAQAWTLKGDSLIRKDADDIEAVLAEIKNNERISVSANAVTAYRQGVKASNLPSSFAGGITAVDVKVSDYIIFFDVEAAAMSEGFVTATLGQDQHGLRAVKAGGKVANVHPLAVIGASAQRGCDSLAEANMAGNEMVMLWATMLGANNEMVQALRKAVTESIN